MFVAVIVIARTGVDVIVEVMGRAGIVGVIVTTSPTVTDVFAMLPQSPLLLWARTLNRYSPGAGGDHFWVMKTKSVLVSGAGSVRNTEPLILNSICFTPDGW